VGVTETEVEWVNNLYPPGTVNIVSQTVRITSGGQYVVDVVVDVVDSVPGISSYDIRLTKT